MMGRPSVLTLAISDLTMTVLFLSAGGIIITMTTDISRPITPMVTDSLTAAAVEGLVGVTWAAATSAEAVMEAVAATVVEVAMEVAAIDKDGICASNEMRIGIE
jgi:hypothetical protein